MRLPQPLSRPAAVAGRPAAPRPVSRLVSNLAAVLRDQGDLDAARTLHERALHIRETRLGAEHPDTQRSRRDLAAVVSALENRS